MHDLYPESISEVTTFKNTVKKIEAQGVRNYTLIMDRGFFSTANIEEMVSADLSFIIPPTSTLKVKEAISTIHSSIDDPRHLKIYEKEPLFVMPVNIEVGENKLRSPRNSAKYWMHFICVPKCGGGQVLRLDWVACLRTLHLPALVRI